jgi:hypothetical protein
MDTVTLRWEVDPGKPVSAAEVLSLIRTTSARGDDPFFVFRACLTRADEANPSFEVIRYLEDSLTWDARGQCGSMTLFADWKAIHGCSDWSCTGRQETRVDVKWDSHLHELVLSATVAPAQPSTHEEF